MDENAERRLPGSVCDPGSNRTFLYLDRQCHPDSGICNSELYHTFFATANIFCSKSKIYVNRIIDYSVFGRPIYPLSFYIRQKKSPARCQTNSPPSTTCQKPPPISGYANPPIPSDGTSRRNSISAASGGRSIWKRIRKRQQG